MHMTAAQVYELRQELQAANRAESRAEEAAVEKLESARLMCRREVAGWAEGRDELVHRLSSEIEDFQVAFEKSNAVAESEALEVRSLRQAQTHLGDEMQRLKRDRDDMHTALCHSERSELDVVHELETTRQQLAGAQGRLEALESQHSAEHRTSAATVSPTGPRKPLSEMTSTQSKMDFLALEHRQLQYEFRAAESRERLSQLEVAEAQRESKEARDDRDSFCRATQSSYDDTSLGVTESTIITDDGRSQRHETITAHPAHAAPDADNGAHPLAVESLVETLKWSTLAKLDPDPARGSTESPRSEHLGTSPSPGRSAHGRPPLAPGSRKSASSRGASASRSPSPSRRANSETLGELRGDRREQLESTSGSLPGREAFRRAEELCAVQRFEEAIPLFEEVLRLLREHSSMVAGRDQQSLHMAQADVWAHLGVAMQSLDRMHEALASYGRAVALNPMLHACFANLAALHNHLKNYESSRRYIEKALAASPSNQAYLEIKWRVEEQHAASRRSEQPPP